jgi:hypothetical protein
MIVPAVKKEPKKTAGSPEGQGRRDFQKRSRTAEPVINSTSEAGSGVATGGG